MVDDPIQDSKSNVCGLYCMYYVMSCSGGKTMKDIVEPFHVHNKTMNDVYVKTFVNKKQSMNVFL